MILAHPVPNRYRQPLLGTPDPQLRKALGISSALGVAWLLLVWLAPAPVEREANVEDLPERFARLIVDEPKPVAPAPALRSPRVEAAQTPPAPEIAPPKLESPPQPRQRPVTRQPEPELAADRGRAGREQARAQVAQQLEQVGSEVSQTLESLASILPASSATESSPPPPRRGGRAPRAGRGAQELGSSTTRSTTAASEISSSGLAAGSSELVDLAAFDLAGVEGSVSAAAPGQLQGSDGGTGERSANSLMATLRRYAPGIRYCYDTALERDRSLRGKMVFRITVAADGSVTAAEVVEDTLNSSEVRRCALAQIQAWRFAAATSASVFNAPFMFRPTE